MASNHTASDINVGANPAYVFFSVIIPAYNAVETLERAVNSVLTQDFEDYYLTVVDDMSTDGTAELIEDMGYTNITRVFSGKKSYNGGSRNRAMEHAPNSLYTLFLDADDEFIDNSFFSKLHNLIIKKHYPDMVRLPYEKCDDSTGKCTTMMYPKNETIGEIAQSPRVAAWTKAVKTRLLVPFPENTLMEDVCQHLAQCDVVRTVAHYPEPAVRWHIHNKSTSHNNSPKWQSSAWRFVADLMDLDLKRDFTKARRDVKLQRAKENLFNGIIAQ